MLTSHFSHGVLKQKIELDPEKWEMGLKQEFPFSKYPPLQRSQFPQNRNPHMFAGPAHDHLLCVCTDFFRSSSKGKYSFPRLFIGPLAISVQGEKKTSFILSSNKVERPTLTFHSQGPSLLWESPPEGKKCVTRLQTRVGSILIPGNQESLTG